MKRHIAGFKIQNIRSHREATVLSFRRDQKFAAAYLNAILTIGSEKKTNRKLFSASEPIDEMKFHKDGDEKELLLALRYVAEAFGGVSKIARKTGLNGTSLYKALSPKGNPRLESLTGVLRAMGMRLSIEPLVSSRR
ncbi:MAG: addiction module antidote protein [Candidatus Liptonbacteria bacterium]|nr:addiction module antidote protein [Candidatus Liptonbacteria bacterium]